MHLTQADYNNDHQNKSSNPKYQSCLSVAPTVSDGGGEDVHDDDDDRRHPCADRGLTMLVLANVNDEIHDDDDDDDAADDADDDC